VSTLPKYFDDLHVGERIVTPARTITETDVVQFAQLTGDWNPIHTDAEFARASPYGERLAHGVLGLAIAIGLLDRTGTFSGSAIANLGFEEWRFTAPIKLGDTVRAIVTITDLRPTSDGTRGIAGRAFELRNQRDEVVQAGRSAIMLKRREQ
jgi:acyl dehydratase